nr:hypothetical protein BAR15_10116 [Bartonella sp. AR 15-3]
MCVNSQNLLKIKASGDPCIPQLIAVRPEASKPINLKGLPKD